MVEQGCLVVVVLWLLSTVLRSVVVGIDDQDVVVRDRSVDE